MVKNNLYNARTNVISNFTSQNCRVESSHLHSTAIVEVEKVVPVGQLHPDDIHLPGIYVHRIVVNATPEKRIEKRTVTTQGA